MLPARMLPILSFTLLIVAAAACSDDPDPTDTGSDADSGDISVDGDPDSADVQDEDVDPGDGLDAEDQSDAPDSTESSARFVVTSPREGDVVAGLVTVRVAVLSGSLDQLTVSVGDQELGSSQVPEGAPVVRFRASDLADDGEVELVVQGSNDLGNSEQTVSVVVIREPPSEANIGPQGGALETESGVVVVIPAGAVETSYAMRVADRLPGGLPELVSDNGFGVLAAIDFLPTGTTPVNLRLLRPAYIQFPVSEEKAGENEMVVAVRVGGGPTAAAWLDVVGSAIRADGSSGIEPIPLMVIDSVENVFAAEEPLQPMNLVLVTGANLPSDTDAQISIGEHDLDAGVMASPDGSSLAFILPPGTEGDSQELTIVDAPNGNRASVTIDVEARDAVLPDLEEADRRIALLFDRLDQELETLESSTPEGSDIALYNTLAIRDFINSTYGGPFGSFREFYQGVRNEWLGYEPDVRIQLGALLGTLEELIASVSIVDPEAITSQDLCVGLDVANILNKVVGYGFTFLSLTGMAPISAAAKAVQKVVSLMIWAMRRAAKCSDSKKGDGIWTFECDILMDRGEAPSISTVVGNVFNMVSERINGVFTYASDVVSGAMVTSNDDASFSATSVTDSAGSFAMIVVADAASLHFDVWPPEGGFLEYLDLAPAEEGDSAYIPIFMPFDGDEDGIPDLDVDYELGEGSDVGLSDDSNVLGVSLGDLDGDQQTDVFLPSSPLEANDDSRIELSYLAINQGDGTFDEVTLGPYEVGTAGLEAGALLHPGPSLDLDQDGDLDILLMIEPLSGEGTLSVLVNEGSSTFEPVALADFNEIDCGAPGGVALGDFVVGDGPDILVLSASGEGDEGLCLLENQGSLSFATTLSATTASSLTGGSFGAVADLDQDGHLDAWFDLQGVVFFGDGAGGFTELEVDDQCQRGGFLDTLPYGYPSPSRVFDYDRDGVLDLFSRVSLPPDDLEPYLGCVLRQSDSREFEVQALADIVQVRLPHGSFSTRDAAPLVFTIDDLDGDGFEDLVFRGDYFHVAYGTTIGLVEADPIFGFQAVSAITTLDMDDNGVPDIMLSTGSSPPLTSFGADALAASQVTNSLGSIVVSLEASPDRPAGPGVRLEVDLDGNEDYAAGPWLLTRVSLAASQVVGVGTADTVSVRAIFPDTGEAGGNIASTTDVGPGDEVVLRDPQAE